jgi:hypothetical protein
MMNTIAKENPECSETENMKCLMNSDILENFVRENRGEWDHDAWLMLCAEIEEKGYLPIDFTTVGLQLEKIKAAYLNCTL